MTIGSKLLAQNLKVRRGMAIALVPITGIIVWSGLIWPIIAGISSQGEWRADVQRSLARDRAIVASEPEIRKQLDALPGSQSARRLYRSGVNGAGANAFQGEIRTLLGAVGAMAQTTTPLATNQQGAVSVLGLRITTSMTIDQLKNFLSRIESHQHYVRIEQLDVMAPSVQPRDENPLLTISMELSAFQTSASEPPPVNPGAAK